MCESKADPPAENRIRVSLAITRGLFCVQCYADQMSKHLDRDLLTISSNPERPGDLATSIAEEIIFMEEGEIIRHAKAALKSVPS